MEKFVDDVAANRIHPGESNVRKLASLRDALSFVENDEPTKYLRHLINDALRVLYLEPRRARSRSRTDLLDGFVEELSICGVQRTRVLLDHVGVNESTSAFQLLLTEATERLTATKSEDRSPSRPKGPFFSRRDVDALNMMNGGTFSVGPERTMISDPGPSREAFLELEESLRRANEKLEKMSKVIRDVFNENERNGRENPEFVHQLGLRRTSVRR